MIPGSPLFRSPPRPPLFGSLLFRADASVAVGTGHVMRCLALAQAWLDAGGRALFAMANTTPAIQARLIGESCEVVSISAAVGTPEDARQTIDCAREQNAAWIVVDGYHFTADYQRALKASGFKVLFLDDYGHALHYSADLVLNQNVCASEDLYVNREPQTGLLLGPRYCLLRREFSAWRDWKREISLVCHRVLVMMGGSDPENLTARVIEALVLAKLDDVETTIVIGGSNPHFATLQNLATQSGLRIKVLRDVSNMAEPMAAADMAISAAGSTCWELGLLGLPSLLIDVADNQTELARELDRRGCAVHVGDRTVSLDRLAEQLKRLVHSQQLRRSLSEHSRELVDGNGAMRIVSILRSTKVRLRRAQADDIRLLWEWANDPDVRAASFSPNPIPWETHVAWFEEKLRVDDGIESAQKAGKMRRLILIAEDEAATPLGQIRFEARPDGDWVVDVSVAGPMRGRGMASQVIQLGVQAILNECRGVRIHAFVKPANVASVRAFERAGFGRSDADQVRGQAAIHFVLSMKDTDLRRN